jgi:hypothetical protein
VRALCERASLGQKTEEIVSFLGSLVFDPTGETKPLHRKRTR